MTTSEAEGKGGEIDWERVWKVFVNRPVASGPSKTGNESRDKIQELVNEAIAPLVRRSEMASVFEDALKEIMTWSKCYCRSEEEVSIPGGETCPTCIAEEALKSWEEGK